MNDGGDRDRPQMAHDDANDSQTLAGGDITRCRAFVQRISYLSVLYDSKANSACDGACQEDWTIPRGKTESKLLVPLAIRMLTGEAKGHQAISLSWSRYDRRTLLLGGIKKQQVVSLSSAESELTSQPKPRRNDLGSRAWPRTWGYHAGCISTWMLQQRCAWSAAENLGSAEHVDVQNMRILEAYKSGQFVTKKVGTSVNPADLITKPLPKPKTEQFVDLMGYECIESEAWVPKCRSTRG